MRTIEFYLEHADELAQDVVNAWGVNVDAGNAKLLTEEFKALFELTCRYRAARETADNRRQFNLLGELEAASERKTREAFVRAYMDFEKARESRVQSGS